jgi:hypothetical protein
LGKYREICMGCFYQRRAESASTGLECIDGTPRFVYREALQTPTSTRKGIAMRVDCQTHVFPKAYAELLLQNTTSVRTVRKGEASVRRHRRVSSPIGNWSLVHWSLHQGV